MDASPIPVSMKNDSALVLVPLRWQDGREYNGGNQTARIRAFVCISWSRTPRFFGGGDSVRAVQTLSPGCANRKAKARLAVSTGFSQSFYLKSPPSEPQPGPTLPWKSRSRKSHLFQSRNRHTDGACFPHGKNEISSFTGHTNGVAPPIAQKSIHRLLLNSPT
jgi:hypothetical protein